MPEFSDAVDIPGFPCRLFQQEDNAGDWLTILTLIDGKRGLLDPELGVSVLLFWLGQRRKVMG